MSSFSTAFNCANPVSFDPLSRENTQWPEHAFWRDGPLFQNAREEARISDRLDNCFVRLEHPKA